MGGVGSGRKFCWGTRPTTDQYGRVDVNMAHRKYRLRPGDALSAVGARINLAWTRQAFGGQRPWLLCPECRRRFAVLYAASQRVRCRLCLRLAYPTQNEREMDRAITAASKIRERLGGRPGIVERFPDRPKGMWWSTYLRHVTRAKTFEARALGLTREYFNAHFRALDMEGRTK